MLNGEDMSFLHGAKVKYAVTIRVEYSEADKSDVDQVLALSVLSTNGNLVPLAEVVSIVETSREHNIYHEDLLPVIYVVGDMAGETDSPLYGMFEIAMALAERELERWFTRQPQNPYEYRLKWDGEW